MDQFINTVQLLPTHIETCINRFIVVCSKMKVDPGVYYSLGAGLFLGTCVLIYLTFYPGDPHSGWDITTDEDRFYAIKGLIESETEEERAKRLLKQGKNTKLTIEQELKEMKEETTLRQRKNKKKKNKNTKSDTTTTTMKQELCALAAAEVEEDIMDDDTSPELTDKEAKAKAFAKSLEGLSDLEIETKMEFQALKQQFGGVENLRKIVKGKKYSDSKPKSGCVYWTVRLINWSIPLGLLFAACYALNQDYNINVLNYLSVWFPREASIFQRMAGNEDIDYGIKMKQ